MRPPFPGVDPYLEAQGYWPDFRIAFSSTLAEAIFDRVPDSYEVRIDQRICRPPDPGPDAMRTVFLADDREPFLKILHRPGRRLVTVIELLSPANKAEPSRRDYLSKRNAIMEQDVHLVELDLLVSGQRLPMRGPLPRGDFHAIVGRSESRPDCQVYSWTLHMPLPALPIPLLAPDPDVWVDLASVYRTAFERGRYARSIVYAKLPDLPFLAD